MKKLILKRISKTGVLPTYGVLLEDETPFAVTLERPWLGNTKGVSCIPDGVDYLCKRVSSPKFGDTFEVTGVPDRDAILFHMGNIQDDSHGCILIAEAFNEVLHCQGVTDSKHGFEEFKHRVDGIGEFLLTVVTV